MAKQVVVSNIPADEVDEMEEVLVKKMKAKNVKRTKNDDGTFTLEGTVAN
jgi:hypothetical protein